MWGKKILCDISQNYAVIDILYIMIIFIFYSMALVKVIRKSSTKFHIKVRKHHFKLRKALFKMDLERNCKYKNVLEFDVEKDGGIIFLIYFFV